MNGLISRQISFIIWALLDSEHGDNEKDKPYNDVNYWKPEITPNDGILNAVLNDLD